MKLISIVGPTAIGKTHLAIQLAKQFKTEIISSDSRQMYQEMNIGTAKPTKEELAQVPHHFIDSLSITEDYSVGKYEEEALVLLNTLFQKYNTVIMVGGSPLYEKAVLEGFDSFPEVDSDIREELNNRLKQEGLEMLQKELKVLDPYYFKHMDIQNPHRLIRALEICIGTGKPFSSFLNKEKKVREFEVERIGLEAPREIIYERINARVDLMREMGLLAEVEKLVPFREYNALQTVGYQELFKFIDGDYDVDFAFEEIKKNTRRFAKRQLTWYRKSKNIQWVNWEKNDYY